MANVIAGAGVVVALLAALAGIYQDVLRRRVFGPRIALSTDVSPFPVGTDGGPPYVDHFFVRLLVEALASRSAVEGLQVTLQSCEPPPRLGDDGPSLQRKPLAIPVRWSFSHEAAVTLAPGQSRYVDLVELPSGRSGARLTTIVTPPERYVLTLDRSYQLGIVLAAKNHPAERWTLHVGPPAAGDISAPITASGLDRVTGKSDG